MSTQLKVTYFAWSFLTNKIIYYLLNICCCVSFIHGHLLFFRPNKPTLQSLLKRDCRSVTCGNVWVTICYLKCNTEVNLMNLLCHIWQAKNPVISKLDMYLAKAGFTCFNCSVIMKFSRLQLCSIRVLFQEYFKIWMAQLSFKENTNYCTLLTTYYVLNKLSKMTCWDFIWLMQSFTTFAVRQEMMPHYYVTTTGIFFFS